MDAGRTVRDDIGIGIEHHERESSVAFPRMLASEGAETGFLVARPQPEAVAMAVDGRVVAIDHIMSHTRDDMASVYRDRISADRLKAVSECVRKWVFEVMEEGQGVK